MRHVRYGERGQGSLCGKGLGRWELRPSRLGRESNLHPGKEEWIRNFCFGVLLLLTAGCGQDGEYRIVYTDAKYRPVAEDPRVFRSKKECEKVLDAPGEERPYLQDTSYSAAGCVPNKRPYPNEVSR